MGAEPAKRTPACERIMGRIVECHGAISVGLLASDLRLSTSTVKRHVRALIEDGRAEVGWDGHQLEATAAELNERAIDARVRSLYPRK